MRPLLNKLMNEAGERMNRKTTIMTSDRAKLCHTGAQCSRSMTFNSGFTVN